MITRGHYIGKIVDDLALLKSQIETRNKLQLFDLTKFCEDFVKELLNIVYDLNLINLNGERSNNPGIDLGDKENAIAYQVTATKISQKINETLSVLTESQIAAYNSINIFIVGTKQGSYTKVENTPSKKIDFDVNRNIIDIDDLLKDIVVLEVEKLDDLFALFKREFRQIRIELEIVDFEGNFKSSLYNQLELKPNTPPLNASKMKDFLNGGDVTFKSVRILYNRLASVPRISREFIAIIAERGTKLKYGNEWGILPQTLSRILGMTKAELDDELIILRTAKLIYIAEEFLEGDDDRSVYYIALEGESLNALATWAKDSKISLKRLLNTMDFTLLDE
jgi:hypothetical protein